MACQFSLILPFYNEAASVDKTLDDLCKVISNSSLSLELVCVDNGSRDQTNELLTQWKNKLPSQITLAQVPTNQGYGWGLICGAKAATGQWLVLSPGDGQLSTQSLRSLMEETLQRKTVFLKGYRTHRSEGFVRRFISLAYNLVFTLLFPGYNIRDINSPPKIIAKEAWSRMKPASKDWFLDAEVVLKAKAIGIDVVELPVDFQDRAGGSSHVGAGTCFEFVKNLIRWKLTGGKAWS